MSIIFQIIAAVLGVAIGLQLPDVDRVFTLFLVHRSIITHGVILPYLTYLAFRGRQHWLQVGVATVALGVAVHLAFDLFPRRYVGYALINAPLIGQLNSTLSVLWIAANVVACSALALWVAPTRRDLGLALTAAFLGFLLVAPREAQWFQPLLALGVGFFIATCLPNPLVNGGTAARRWTATARAAVRRP